MADIENNGEAAKPSDNAAKHESKSELPHVD